MKLLDRLKQERIKEMSDDLNGILGMEYNIEMCNELAEILIAQDYIILSEIKDNKITDVK